MSNVSIALDVTVPSLDVDRLVAAAGREGVVVDRASSGVAGQGPVSAHVRVVAAGHDCVAPCERWERHVADGAAPTVELAVCGRRSARYALVDVARRIIEGRLVTGSFREGPAFRVRGVLEGFYGPPWSSTARLEMISFAARHRFNTFMYAPKGDRFLRDDWRVPHSGAERRELVAFIEACASEDIDAMVGVSPGLSMAYSNRDDRDLLVDKVTSLSDMGATRIAVLFDDIAPRLQHRADLDAYEHLADAHAEVANEVGAVLAARDVALVVCPTAYSGSADDPYLRRLGTQLSARTDMFHTGRAICSPAITAHEAVEFTRSTLRRPLYWDNYPVNDLSMQGDLHIGPYRGRDPLLGRFSEGVMANAMEYPEASKIPLATIGDFLWDPDSYEPESSWKQAIRDVIGPDLAESFEEFADCARRSCLSDHDPWLLNRALEDFWFSSAYGDPADARSRLHDRADAMRRSERALRGAAATLLDEIAPWLDTYALGCDAVAAIAEHWPAVADTAEHQRVVDLAVRLSRSEHRLFGDSLNMALDELCSSSAIGAN